MNKAVFSILVICMAFALIGFKSIEKDGIGKETLLCRAGKIFENQSLLGGVFQPSVISTSTGKVMVFSQGRIKTSADDADKTLVYNFSVDQGKTWSKPKFLTRAGCFWGIGSYLSTTPSGKEKISVMFTYGKKELFKLYDEEELENYFNINKDDYPDDCAAILYRMTSVDDGKTWRGSPVREDILGRFYGPDKKYLAFFSPIGQTHVIKEGPWKGRYIIAGPFKGNDEGPIPDSSEIYDYTKNGSCLIYSDDQGESWKFAGATPPGGNEASAVPINNGKTIIMVRRRNDEGNRIVNYSDDCGVTWTKNQDIPDIPETRCLGVMKKYDDMIMLTAPRENSIRTKGRVCYSLDDGKTWQGKTIQKGLFSYSDFTRVQGTDTFVVVYSHGFHGEFGLFAKTFKKSWLFAQ
jgi:BNR repeat protein